MVKVSVIIPTFNCASLLPLAIESVLNQTFSDYEIIIVDDGSTDDTPSIINKYIDRVQYIPIKHAGLPAIVRNVGIQAARGKYLAFLDSDDRWLANKLKLQVPILENDLQLGLVCGNSFVKRAEDLNSDNVYFRDDPVQSNAGLLDLLNKNFIITSTVLIRKSLIDEVGKFSELPELRALEDYDLWLRLATRAKILYLSDPLIMYFDRPGTSVRSMNTLSFHYQANLLILDRIGKWMKDKKTTFEVPESILLKRKLAYHKSLIKYLWQEHLFFQSINAIWEFFEKHPRHAIKTALQKLSVRSAHTTALSDELSIDQNKYQNEKLRLHLGCGEVYLPGYINIDYPPSQHTVQVSSKADQYADITQLHFDPESVQEIRLHHVFEHFSRSTSLRLLIEWYSWLEEGGKLIIETPDFERSLRAFLRKKQPLEFVSLRHIFGSQEAQWAVHYDGWYRRKFDLVLSQLGYKDLKYIYSNWKGTYNITVCAIKRSPFIPPENQFKIAEDFLHLSLVDEGLSEQRLFQVWTDELHKGNTSTAK